MGPSIWQILIILLVVLILFGGNRLPNVMGDLAKGIKNFRSELKGENDAKNAKVIDAEKKSTAKKKK